MRSGIVHRESDMAHQVLKAAHLKVNVGGVSYPAEIAAAPLAMKLKNDRPLRRWL